MHMTGCAFAMMHVWRSEGSLQKSVLSFCYGDPRDKTGCQAGLAASALTHRTISPAPTI